MNWGPLEEKPRGSGLSMSRLIALLFAVTYCLALTRGGAHEAGWPFAALGIVIVLAVPLQALFKTLQSWFATAPGKAMLTTLLEKVVTTAPMSTRVTTEVAPSGDLTHD